MQSVRLLHEDLTLIVGLVDKVDGYFNPDDEPFRVILAEDLGIPCWDHFAMKYDIMELNTAIKPYLMEYIFEETGADKVIYFDPDVIVYHPLNAIIQLLETYTFILTPHLLTPLNDDKSPSERSIMMAGTYNLGFIAIAKRGDWQRMLQWWQSHLYSEGFSDATNGMFTDQRWIDLVPSLFDKVHILRNPAYNIAYWNFKTRQLHTDSSGRYLVDGEPLVFFHFSGYSVKQPDVVSKHQNRFTFDNLNDTYRRIFHEYHQIMVENGYHKAIEFPYAYGEFEDGVKITAPVRTCLREYDLKGEVWGNPFDIQQPDNFREWARHPIKHNTRLSPIALTVYRMSPYVRKLFQDIMSERGQQLFLRWFINQAEKGLVDPYFVQPTQDYLNRLIHNPLLRLRSRWQLISSKVNYYTKNPDDFVRVFMQRRFGVVSQPDGKPPLINIEQQRVNALVEDDTTILDIEHKAIFKDRQRTRH